MIVAGSYHVVEPSALEEHLGKIMTDASNRGDGEYVGSMTCGVRPPWEDARCVCVRFQREREIERVDVRADVVCACNRKWGVCNRSLFFFSFPHA
jgi:hypothetical protein